MEFLIRGALSVMLYDALSHSCVCVCVSLRSRLHVSGVAVSRTARCTVWWPTAPCRSVLTRCTSRSSAAPYVKTVRPASCFLSVNRHRLCPRLQNPCWIIILRYIYTVQHVVAMVTVSRGQTQRRWLVFIVWGWTGRKQEYKSRRCVRMKVMAPYTWRKSKALFRLD